MINHPLLKNKTSILSFVSIWAFIMIVHFLATWQFSGFNILVSLLDAFISSLTYAAVSLGLWFSVRYGIKGYQYNLRIIAHNLVLYAVTTVFWLGILWMLYNTIGNDMQQIFSQTVAIRFILALLLYLSTVLVYYTINYYRSFTEKQAQEMHLKNLVKEAQLNELRSQLHPHFLFNSLNSINALIIEKPEQASEMLVKLSDFLRYSLSQKGHKMTTFEKELHHTMLYLDIEKIRFGNRLVFDCETDKSLSSCTLPLMLLQPLLENAVKHGVYNALHTVNISLKAEKENGYMKLSIQNNYEPDAVPKKGAGTGINNVRERLRLVYGNNQKFEISDIENVFTVTIMIPPIEKEKHDEK